MEDMVNKINESLLDKYISAMRERNGKCPFMFMGVGCSHCYTMDNYLHGLPDIWCGSTFFNVINGMINDCRENIESGEIKPGMPIGLEDYVVNGEPARIVFREASVVEAEQIEEMCMVGRMERLLKDKPDVYEALSEYKTSPKWWIMEIPDINNMLPGEEGYVPGNNHNVSVLHARYMDGIGD